MTTRQRDTEAAKAAILEDLVPPPPGVNDISADSGGANSGGGGGGGDNGDYLARRLAVVRCDVTDEESIREAARRAAELFPRETHHLHLGCALVGILRPEKSLAQVDAEKSLESFRVNTIGPLLLAKHFTDFLPRRATSLSRDSSSPTSPSSSPSSSSSSSSSIDGNLPQHATWLTASARVGSTSDNRSGGWFSYRASKAAVISLTKSIDLQLRARSGPAALAVAYHPGTVRTDLSKEFWAGVPEGKLFSPEYAAERLLDVVCGLETAQRGRCWDWKGEEVHP